MATKKSQDTAPVAVEAKAVKASDIRSRIQAADDLELFEFYVEGWDTTIWIKPLTYRERRDAIKAAGLDKGGEPDLEKADSFSSAVTIECVRDKEGNKVFGMADMDWLKAKSTRIVDALHEKVAEISGLNSPELRRELRERVEQRRASSS